MELTPRLTPAYRRLAAVVLVAAAAVAFWAALQPQLAPPDTFEADKFIHIGAFAFLGGLASLAAPNRRLLVIAALALVGLGTGIEIGQSMVPGRSASLLDLAGDVVGIIGGIAAVGLMAPIWLRIARTAPECSAPD
jgi:VanZ family protein